MSTARIDISFSPQYLLLHNQNEGQALSKSVSHFLSDTLFANIPDSWELDRRATIAEGTGSVLDIQRLDYLSFQRILLPSNKAI